MKKQRILQPLVYHKLCLKTTFKLHFTMCKLSVVSLKYKQAYPENKINN